MTNLSKLRAALLGSGAMLALAAGPAFASETDNLRAQIDTLQARLDQLEKQQASTEAKPAVAPAPADAVVGGDYPGSFKLPGSDTSYSIHGYTKLDYIMDIDQTPLGQSIFFTSLLRPNNAPAGNQGFRTILFPHQSRLIFESRTPTNYGQLITHIEGDFRGNFAGNDNVLPDNKGGFRIRNAYGQLGPVRAGNDYDLLDPLFFASIEKVTFFSPAGPTDAKRTVLIRYSQPSGVSLFQQPGNLVFSGEVELPGSESGNSSVANGTAQMFLPGGTKLAAVSDQQLEVPNLNAGVDYGGPWGHTRLAGQLRFFHINDGLGGDVGGTNHTVDEVTYLGQVAFGLNLGYFLPSMGKDRLVGIANWGSGAAGQENGIDDKESITVVNFGGAGQKSFTNPVWGVSGGVQHWWTPNIRSNAGYFFSKIHLSHEIAGIDPTASTQTTDTQSFLINLIWSPVKQVNFGLEYLYGERHGLSNATGYTAHGTDNRIHIGLQYLF